MKALFFIALLINIVFFLWEINSVDSSIALAITSENKVAKQILLVSELSKNNEKSDIIITENYKDKVIKIDASESITNEREHQPVEAFNIYEGISENDVILGSLDEKSEVELLVPQQTIDDITVLNRTESDEKNPVLNQKVLVEADGGDEETVLAERKSFWSDFTFIFDKENNYSSQINESSSNSKGFLENTRDTDVGNSSFSSALKKWSISFFGQPSNKDDGVSKGEINNKILAKTQEQAKKRYCYEVGPFPSYQAIEKWRKSNKITKDSLKKFNINNQVVSSYLVYHLAEDNFQQSKKIAKKYKKKQLSEVWLFRKGDLRGAISFGLFRKEKNAVKLQKRLIKNGLNAEIIERYKTQTDQYARILTHAILPKSALIISKKQTINDCK